MTPERAIELAKQAGFKTKGFNSIDGDEVLAGRDYEMLIVTDQVLALCALAYNAGLEDAAKVCDELWHIDGTETASAFSAAIRARKA